MTIERVLIIGGTGAQGIPIAQELRRDGKYKVRVLTRDPENKRAKYLESIGVELVKGDVKNDEDILLALTGMDAVFVNTDTFTMGVMTEVYWGIRIFEIAQQVKSVQYFIWSTLPYLLKSTGYNEKYNAAHYSAKGRVADFIAAHPGSDRNYPGLKYAFFSTCPYMDTIADGLPPVKKPDHFSFDYPIGDAKMPLISLEDIGKFVRHMIDNMDDWVGKTLEASSQSVSVKELAEVFTEVTGLPCSYNGNVTTESMFKDVPDDKPFVAHEPEGLRYKDSFVAWWNIYYDGKANELKDYKVLDAILPERLTVKKWMQKAKFNGDRQPILKLFEDSRDYARFVKNYK